MGSNVPVVLEADVAKAKDKIAVIGAGVAGLAAARTLAEAGKSVLVIEGRDRTGGRVFTLNQGLESVELGAEFVHGKPTELWRLLQEAHLHTQELEGSHFCWHEERLSDCESLLDCDFQWIGALKQWQGNDCSFADYLLSVPAPEASKTRLIDYVEGFNAADHREIGVRSLGKQQAAEDAIEGDRIFHVTGGYHQVPDLLARALIRAGGEIMLNAQVLSIDWERGAIGIKIRQGEQSTLAQVSKAIITVPLGVLLSGNIDIRPYPRQPLEAAMRLKMGTVQRIVLQFREPFWRNGTGDSANELSRLSFLYNTGNAPSVWWTPFPESHCRLTAWTGGPRVTLLPQKQADLEEYLLSSLAHLFGRDESTIRRLFVCSYAHDWQHDPFTLGAYSYAAVNGEDASEQMSKPVEETLYFAGEHTDVTGHWGTVHGAIRSGYRAASQILNLQECHVRQNK